jgi:mannose-6-phosphate isomerase-like protein (cupin superfamily)
VTGLIPKERETEDIKLKNSFPDQIKNLPVFEGPFEAFKLAAQGCDVLFASYPAGTNIPPHKHNTDNIGVITNGELTLTIRDQTKKFGIGDWYHVPAHVEHSAIFDTDTAEIEFWFQEKES